MATDADLLEEVVRRVVLALQTPAATIAAPVERPTPAVPVVTESVVTRKILEQAINGSTTVRLSPRALLTPAARDFIRERGLQIVRDEPRTNRVHSRWQIWNSTSDARLLSALQWLTTNHSDIAPRITGTSDETAAQAIAVLCRGEASGILVFTDQPEKTACLANRHERVFAAAAESAANLSRLRQSWQPNLLAIDPRSKSQLDLQQLLKAVITFP